MRFLSIITVLFLFTLSPLPAQQQQSQSEAAFIKGRALLASAVDNEDDLRPARRTFLRIAKNDIAGRGRAMVYLGALDLIEANHTFWPTTKMTLTRKGLDKMSKGLRVDPNDIEARFIHGAICHQLPFFFGLGDEVEEDFATIISLLADPEEPCADDIVRDMQEFIGEEDVLTEAQRDTLKELLRQRREK